MFGLSFANPAMLYGLWAALLPIVIHLLNRRRTVTVSFSNVALLQTLQHDRMKRVKIKQIVLLILRTLLIILLVLAFARPTVTGAQGQVGDANTSAVVLLDRSLSMHYRTSEGTLFERAIRKVHTVFQLFGERDDVHLILVDEDAEEADVTAPEQLKLHLDTLQPGFGRTNFEAGVIDAVSYLSASQMPNRELYIATDGAANGWASLPDTLALVDGLSVFMISERPQEVANLGIGQIKAVGGAPQIGRSLTLEINLINYGEANRGDVPVQIFLDDRRIAQQVAHVPARGRRKLHTAFVPEVGGAVALRVEIGEDNLRADNERVTVLDIPDQVRALLVADTPLESYFLSQALPVASYEVLHTTPGRISEQVLDGVDVVFLCNVTQLSPGAIGVLQSRVSSGLGMAIFLGDRANIRHYNEQLLPALIPATLHGARGTSQGAYQALPTVLPDHPMLAELELNGEFQSPHFSVYYRIQPGQNVHPILSFASGIPALIESRKGSGRVALFASSVGTNLNWNDAPLSGFFLPFVHRLTGYLAAGAFGGADYRVGQVVYRNLHDGHASEAVLQAPDQEPKTIWPEQRGLQNLWPIGKVKTPGLWEIYARERLADRFGVQVDEREPDLSPVSLARLESLFGANRVTVIDGAVDLQETVLARRHGQELWRSFLWVALVVMGAEMLIARSTRTSRNEPSEDGALVA